ncbi:MAG: zf-HC2 domain-containing protein [Cyanobacteria bacterium]|nr:zf-HC2 domain-containing protein [Cyanobacteriota bacterium]
MTAYRDQSVLPEYGPDTVHNSHQDDKGDDANTIRELDVVKRDRFELLSAYLDGEVTPDERRLVEQWLQEDAVAQCLYQRLLHLRNVFQVLCQSSWQPDRATPDAVAAGVVERLHHRFNLTCMAGFAAAAVAVVGSLSGAIGSRPWGALLTRVEAPAPPVESPLEIALDQPVIPIPKTAVASDRMMERVVQQTQDISAENTLPLAPGLVESEL